MILALRDGPGLKEDLQILLKFWSMMLSDKKYIKTQIVGGKSSCFLVSIQPSLVIVVPVMFELTLLIDATITIAAIAIKSVPQ